MLNDAILISLVCGVVALVYGGVTAAIASRVFRSAKAANSSRHTRVTLCSGAQVVPGTAEMRELQSRTASR